MGAEKDLSNLRLEQAEQCLKEAKLLFENAGYKGAANRAYYCVFHSMRSLLALDRVDFKSHKAVMSHFREKYIKTSIFDVTLSRILTNLHEIRSGSDYDDHCEVERDEIEQHIKSSEIFFNQVRAYLERTTNDA
ncbi:MAG: HEPN domain-containing protein [Oscillospiraceae bacterium]|nr:HEPN domain-containing protein [Oscillospiraceae bacterium]